MIFYGPGNCERLSGEEKGFFARSRSLTHFRGGGEARLDGDGRRQKKKKKVSAFSPGGFFPPPSLL